MTKRIMALPSLAKHCPLLCLVPPLLLVVIFSWLAGNPSLLQKNAAFPNLDALSLADFQTAEFSAMAMLARNLGN